MARNNWWQAARLPIILSCIWCAFMFVLYQRGSASNEVMSTEQALIQARTLYIHVLDTRAWNAAHGGVYVRQSEYGQPNIWIPEDQRTLLLPDGSRLALVNPAYMSRQISERSSTPGVGFRITSHTPLRPENASDTWETQALTACIKGAPEVFARVQDGKQERFRYLGALHTQASCLGCHPENRLGDVRGGISVSLDAATFVRDVAKQNHSLMLAYGLMAMAGSLCIGGISSFMHRKKSLKEEQERMKNTFMANMSHDMRTPLTGILGMTELLARSVKTETDRKTLQYLQLAGASLLEIVSDITDYAVMDSEQLELQEKVFDLYLSLERCMDLFRPQCVAKALSLDLHINPSVPRLLLGDEFRLRQALGNLLSNSTKFTDEGGISVSVSVVPSLLHGPGTLDAGAARAFLTLRIEVVDTGPGITAQEHKKIFDRFERGSAALQSGLQGTGLGLSIAHDIARRMNGSIGVTSAPGQGAAFALTVQFRPVEPDSPLGQSAACVNDMARALPRLPWQRSAVSIAESAKQEGIVRGHVLVAEDNAVTAHFVRQVLLQAGYTVHMARDGKEVENYLAEHKVDLLLLDMRMPGKDGLSTVKTLQKRYSNATHNMPIVVMSASVLGKEKNLLAELGVQSILLKPVSTEELLRVVADHIQPPIPTEDQGAMALSSRASTDSADRADRADRAPVDSFSDNTCPGSLAPVFDVDAALAAMDGNEALLRSLCTVWLEEGAKRRADGRQPLGSRPQDEEAQALTLLAHSIKNSAGTLHLPRLHLLATQMEVANLEEQCAALTALQEAEDEARKHVQMWLNAGQKV